MKRPVIYVVAIIVVGSLFAGAVHYGILAGSADAQGNQLPYKNETVEFPDMGPEQFIDPSPEPRFRAERERALGIKSSP